MADGYYLPPPEWGLIGGITTNWTGEHPFTPGPPVGWELAERTLLDSLDRIYYNAIPALSFGGEVQHAYFNDYYNRIYLIPRTLDFGEVSTDVTRTLTIWNAYAGVVSLDSIEATNDEGISVEGDTPPFNIGALATTQYVFTATTEGPPRIDATYAFDFGNGDARSLSVFGNRANLWPFAINWRQPYRVVYEYRTDIITSRSGREQRRSLRATPRKRIEFLTTLKKERLRRFNQLMASAHDLPFVIPEYPRRAVATSAMGPGTDTIELEQVPAWIVENAIVLLDYQGVTELRGVESIDGNEITFTSSSTANWPVGTVLHPGVSGLVIADLSTVRQTNEVVEASMVLSVTPASEPEIEAPEPSVEFNGREVFLKKPNWAQPVNLNEQHEVEMVDYGFGRSKYFQPIDFSTRLHRATYVGRNYAEGDALLQFFNRMKGQRGEFYMPTWEPDIVFTPPAFSGTVFLDVPGTDFYNAYAGDKIYKAVMVWMTDGTFVFRSIVDITLPTVAEDEAAFSRVTVNEGWPQDLTAQNVLMVCWLPVYRFASDALTLEWLTNTVCQTQLALRTLEDL